MTALSAYPIKFGRWAVLLDFLLLILLPSQDVITDMVCEPQDIPGCPGLLAHRGMVLSATNIITALEKDAVLEKAFSLYPVSYTITFQLLLLVTSYCGFSLRVFRILLTGHIKHSTIPRKSFLLLSEQ